MAKRKILIVDDAKTALLMAQMAVGREEYQVITAGNGVEAIDKAVTELPDLILMDVIMPKLGGFEATKRLRALDVTKDIPIIMVTTRSEEENVQQGFEAGCNDYLTKPLNPAELLAKIRHYLGEPVPSSGP
jgi:CheY-like chemotaxis protein